MNQIEPLSADETATFRRLEKIIEPHKNTMVAVGVALIQVRSGLKCFCDSMAALEEIRDKKLYRSKFSTFEDYCQKKWNLSRQRVSQLSLAWKVWLELPKELSKKIDKPATMAAIGKVPPEKRLGVVASIRGKVTAKAIKAALQSTEPIDVEAEYRDRTDYIIPKGIVPLWKRGEEVQEVLNRLGTIKSTLVRAKEQDDPLWREVTQFTQAIEEVEKLWNSVKCGKPYAVCSTCQGHPDTQAKGCRMCLGRGFISEFRYKHTVPEEIKQVREKGIKK